MSQSFHVGGKLAPRRDSRTLRLATYVTAASLPTPPASLSYADRVRPWPMYANDVLGDCTIAAAGHMIELWAKLAATTATPTTATIKNVYRQLSPNDQGCVMLDVLRYWRKVGIGGHKIDAFAALDLHDDNMTRLSCMLFGGVYLGLALPKSAEAQVGKVWDVPSSGPNHGAGARNSWGGHGVNLVAYDEQGPSCVTWGNVQKMTWAFYHAYSDEAYAPLTGQWERAHVPGIDFAALKADLAHIGKIGA